MVDKDSVHHIEPMHHRQRPATHSTEPAQTLRRRQWSHCEWISKAQDMYNGTDKLQSWACSVPVQEMQPVSLQENSLSDSARVLQIDKIMIVR